MMDFITAPAIVGICIYGLYSIFELYARRKERMALIEKWNGSYSGEVKFGKIEYSSRFGSLKWGCLLLGIGLGLLIGFLIGGQYVNYGDKMDWGKKDLLSIIYGASVLLCGGIGMVAAFLIEYRLSRKKDREQ